MGGASTASTVYEIGGRLATDVDDNVRMGSTQSVATVPLRLEH